MKHPLYCILVVLFYTCTEVRGDFTCPPGVEGFFAPEGQCSSEYYACVNGVSYPRTCPNGEVFDPANKHCVPYDQASCRYATTTMPTTTSTPPSPCKRTTCYNTTTTASTTTRTTTTTKPSGVFYCPYPDGFFPIPGACSSEYYVCIANFPYLTQCPNGNIFDPVALVCKSPDEASCSKTPLLLTNLLQ